MKKSTEKLKSLFKNNFIHWSVFFSIFDDWSIDKEINKIFSFQNFFPKTGHSIKNIDQNYEKKHSSD